MNDTATTEASKALPLTVDESRMKSHGFINVTNLLATVRYGDEEVRFVMPGDEAFRTASYCHSRERHEGAWLLVFIKKTGRLWYGVQGKSGIDLEQLGLRAGQGNLSQYVNSSVEKLVLEATPLAFGFEFDPGQMEARARSWEAEIVDHSEPTHGFGEAYARLMHLMTKIHAGFIERLAAYSKFDLAPLPNPAFAAMVGGDEETSEPFVHYVGAVSTAFRRRTLKPVDEDKLMAALLPAGMPQFK